MKHINHFIRAVILLYILEDFGTILKSVLIKVLKELGVLKGVLNLFFV